MSEKKDYYKLLGVKRTASQDNIDAAYERLLDWKEKFPRAFVDRSSEDINLAYDILSDPESRRAYDQGLPTQNRFQRMQSLANPTHYDLTLVPEKKESCLAILTKELISFIVTSIFFALIALMFADANSNGSRSSPQRSTRPSVTRSFSQDKRISGQTCVARTDRDLVPVLDAKSDNADEISTINADITFFGIWNDDIWFEFDDARLGQPTSGYIRLTDIQILTCYG